MDDELRELIVNRCPHCGQSIAGLAAQPTFVQPNVNGAMVVDFFGNAWLSGAAAGAAPLQVYTVTLNAARAILIMLALLAPAFADAPAPSPKPRPRAVATPRPSPSPEPFDLPPVDVPGEPQPDSTPPPAPAPSPSPSPTSLYKANARPFRVSTQLGALATVTGETGTDITPTFWINANGPIALGNDRSYGRLGARIGLSSSPGQTFNAADVKTYRAAAVGLWGGYVIGHLRDVDTTLVVEGDFASRLKGSADPAPMNRLVRSAGIGIRFDAAKSNASMTVLAGFDEASASCASTVICTGLQSGFAFMVYGQVPIVQGAVLFTGDVTLSVGQAVAWVKRRDILRIGVVVDPAEVLKVVKGTAK